MRVAFAVVAALATVCLASARAFADTPDGVRQRLIAAEVAPNPVFPAYLPPAWQAGQASFTYRGPAFEIDYTNCCDSMGAYTQSVAFGRKRYAALDEELRLVHGQRHHYRRVRIGPRHVYLFHEDTRDGYIWHEQYLTYFLSAQNGVLNRPSLHLLARVVASLAPLG